MYIPSYKKVKNSSDSSYKFAILVAQRAKELNDGAQAHVDTKDKNHVSVAMEEIIKGCIVEDTGNE